MRPPRPASWPSRASWRRTSPRRSSAAACRSAPPTPPWPRPSPRSRRGRRSPAALEAQNLPDEALGAALGALQPDPARRDTVGGPAPKAVLSSLDGFDARAAELEKAVAAAQGAAEAPFDLLTKDIPTLLET